VWLIGLLAMVVAGGLVAGVVLLVVTLVAALAGGKVGRNYHRKVDAAFLQ